MLVEFSVGNYRSFKEKATLSMAATPLSSKPASLDEENVFQTPANLRLLTSAAVYGANASGKSNLIAAMRFMRKLVLSSARETQVTETIDVEPFLLSTDTNTRPSFFEVVFEVSDAQYRYGFEVTAQQVVAEWLYRMGSTREARLFERTAEDIDPNKRTFREGRGLKERTRPNALFLSVAAQFNGPIAKSILEWFQRFAINTGVNDSMEMALALSHFADASQVEKVGRLIKRMDTGIEGFVPAHKSLMPALSTDSRFAGALKALWEALGEGDMPSERPIVQTLHQVFDGDGKPVGQAIFDLEDQESAGTQRLFVLLYPLLRALDQGSILAIDELDARIHPNLAIELIRLFNSRETNLRHAQLILTTHNTNLLNAHLFRRDQIWFAEKTRQGASNLFSLVEYRVDGKVVRNDASFEKDYVTGRYGAIPFVGDLRELLGETIEQTSEE